MSITDIIAGKWSQLSGHVKTTWGKLTDDEIIQIAGNKDILMGKLQEKYGWTKEEAEAQISEFYENTKSQFAELKEGAENLVEDVKDGAKNMAEDVKNGAKDAVEDVKDEAESIWGSMISKVKSLWADMTDDELAEIKRDKEALIEKIANKYQISKEEARQKIDEIN